jgi:hypothetical protein
MLQAITAQQEEMQSLAQEKIQLQNVLDSCAVELRVRHGQLDMMFDCWFAGVQAGCIGARTSCPA